MRHGPSGCRAGQRGAFCIVWYGARALTRSGIPSRMMPRPRALEASCGTAVRFSSRQPVDILLTLAPVKTLYRVEQGSYWPVG